MSSVNTLDLISRMGALLLFFAAGATKHSLLYEAIASIVLLKHEVL